MVARLSHMLSKNATLTGYKQVLSQKRYVFIPRATSNVKIKKKQKIPKSFETWHKLDSIDSMSIEDSKIVEKKLQKLQNFTKNLKQKLSDSPNHLTIGYETLSDLDKTDLDRDADEIYRSLTSDNETSLLTTKHKQKNNSQQLPNLTDIISQTQVAQATSLLPEKIQKIIDNDELIIKYLSNKTQQNWNPIIEQLYSNKEKVKKLSNKSFKKFLSLNIQNLSFDSINKLDEIFNIFVDNKLEKFSFAMYNCLFKNISKLSYLGPIQSKDRSTDNNSILCKLKDLIQRYDKTVESSQIKNNKQLTERERQHNMILNYCITYTSKSLNVTTVDYFLKHFKEKYDISPDRFTYTNIIQFYSKLNLSDKAWDVFDTMKFLSTAHSPDTKTYNNMLTICQKTKNYAKAIDLFHEMKDRKITPSVETFSLMGTLLATCSSDNISSEGNNEALRLLGWKFISGMINKDDLFSVGAMMSLAAYDGDVAVARAIYFEYTMNQYRRFKSQSTNDTEAWQRAMNPVLFNYLLLAYSKFIPGKIPLLVGWDEGRNLRRDLLNFADYTLRNYEDCQVILPFLPLIELNDIDQVLFESNALWHFHLNSGRVTEDYLSYPDIFIEAINQLIKEAKDLIELQSHLSAKLTDMKSQNSVNYQILNYKCLLTYLTIPIRLNKKEEYYRRLKLYTFDQCELSQTLEHIIEKKTLPLTNNKNEVAEINESEKRLTLTNSDVTQFFISLQHKLMMENSLYANCMKAATQFHDSNFGSDIWRARGEFRKTSHFTVLSMRDRINSDTEFAKIMVNFFTEQKQYTDALSIILSSQRYINWTYPMIKPLHHALIELEDERSINRLLEVINKKDPIKDLNLQIEELSL